MTFAHRASAVALVVAASLSACAEPSGSATDYTSKAHQTAKDLVSAVETARLMAVQLLAGRTTMAYADVVISGAERDANSIQTTFDSRQPPDRASGTLRDTVDQPMQDVVSALGDLRIAVRRSNRKGIRAAVDDLAKPLEQLQRLSR